MIDRAVKHASGAGFYHVLLLVYALALAMLAFLGRRDEFTGLICLNTLAFGAFGGLLGHALLLKRPATSAFVVIAVLRLSMLWAEPSLSDDYYRYWWDGWIGLHHIDVYAHTPRELLDYYAQEPFAVALARNFFLLNSPDYHSVYPAFSQFIFRISAWMSGEDLWRFQCCMKLIFLMGDLIGITALFSLLPRFGLGRNHALLYYGNPLVILELFGNLHTEHFMVSFFILALYCSHRARRVCFAPALVLSALAKLTVLIWWPFFIRKPLLRKHHLYIALALVATGISLWLFSPGGRAGFLQSLKLYFQTFEFNSALYLHLKTAFHNAKLYELEHTTGWMLLGAFALCYGLILFRHVHQQHCTDQAQFEPFWWSLALYLLLSSTVHPWYLCPLLLPGIFYRSATSLLWSYLVVWSYAFYDADASRWSPLLTTAQYFAVALSLWIEYRYHKTHSIQGSASVQEPGNPK